MMQSQEPTIICMEKVSLDMCGRCARPLGGYTGTTLNHWCAGDPERALCTIDHGKFEPAPRLCMLSEKDHENKIPEFVEALRQTDWSRIPYHTGPSFGIGREGLLILAQDAATVLAVEPHVFKPGILCPSCGGERLLDEIVGSVPGLRPRTRMPIVSGRKTRCSECDGVGVTPSTL